MATKRNPCSTPGCDRDIEHKESGLCKRCYAFQHYWKGRTVTQRMKRVHQIEYWNQRAHSLLMPANVSTITKSVKKRKIG